MLRVLQSCDEIVEHTASLVPVISSFWIYCYSMTTWQYGSSLSIIFV